MSAEDANQKLGGLILTSENDSIDDAHVTIPGEFSAGNGGAASVQVGGLIHSATNGSISNSSVTFQNSPAVNFSGEGGALGGFIHTLDGTTITNSKVVGTIQNNNDDQADSIYAGFVLAMNSGSISNSYSRLNMTVEANLVVPLQRVGGFVYELAGGTIDRAYYAGSITTTGAAVESFDFIAISSGSGIITNSFYDSTIGPDTETVAVGKTTADMQSAVPYANWFTSNWVFTSGQYPKLIWE